MTLISGCVSFLPVLFIVNILMLIYDVVFNLNQYINKFMVMADNVNTGCPENLGFRNVAVVSLFGDFRFQRVQRASM